MFSFFGVLRAPQKHSKLRYFFFSVWSYGGNICLLGNRGIGEKENRAPGGTRGTRETEEQANKRTRKQRKRGTGEQEIRGSNGTVGKGEGNKKTREQ